MSKERRQRAGTGMSRHRAGGQDWACSEFTETRMSGIGMAEERALGNAARWGKGQLLRDLKNR